MEPCGTPARISTQEEHWPFKTTLWLFVLCGKFLNEVFMLPT